MDQLLHIFSSFDLDPLEIGLYLLAGFLIGSAKAGIKGMGTVSVPILALIFGAKASTGIMLPLLLMADVGAVIFYKKETNWTYLKKILPASVVGILIATWIGNSISETTFKYIMAFVILFCLMLLLIWEKYGNERIMQKYTSLSTIIGVGVGVTTMIGNLAGPLLNIYLLMAKIPKRVFIATSAVFFLVINIIKLPFHIFVWKTLNLDTLLLNFYCLPAIILGLISGIYLVRLMSEKFFKTLVVTTTTLSAILLLVK